MAPAAAKGESGTTIYIGCEPTGVSDKKKRRQRDSGPARSSKKFVKSGFDTRKF